MGTSHQCNTALESFVPELALQMLGHIFGHMPITPKAEGVGENVLLKWETCFGQLLPVCIEIDPHQLFFFPMAGFQVSSHVLPPDTYPTPRYPLMSPPDRLQLQDQIVPVLSIVCWCEHHHTCNPCGAPLDHPLNQFKRDQGTGSTPMPPPDKNRGLVGAVPSSRTPKTKKRDLQAPANAIISEWQFHM